MTVASDCLLADAGRWTGRIDEESPAPCGGFAGSGNGAHFGGVANLDLFTDWQWRTSRPVAMPFPF